MCSLLCKESGLRAALFLGAIANGAFVEKFCETAAKENDMQGERYFIHNLFIIYSYFRHDKYIY